MTTGKLIAAIALIRRNGIVWFVWGSVKILTAFLIWPIADRVQSAANRVCWWCAGQVWGIGKDK